MNVCSATIFIIDDSLIVSEFENIVLILEHLSICRIHVANLGYRTYIQILYEYLLHLCLVSNLRQCLLQALDRLAQVFAVGICHADTHVPATNVLRCNLLVQTTSKDDALLQQVGENLRGCNALGQVNGGHAVGLVLRLGSKLLQTKVSNSLLDLLRCGLVVSKALLQRTRQNLLECSVQSVHELGRRCGEVGCLLGLVVLHDCGDVSPKVSNCVTSIRLLGSQFFHDPK